MPWLVVLAAVVLLLLLAAYVLTRPLPPPGPPPAPAPGTCESDGDCLQYPQTCNLISGVCADFGLPPLLTRAQNAVTALYVALGHISDEYTTAIPQQYAALQRAATAAKLGIAPFKPLQAALTAGLKTVRTYIAKRLVSPTCDPTLPTSCGYYTTMMFLTAVTPAAYIQGVCESLLAGDAQGDFGTVTTAFGPVAKNLAMVILGVRMHGSLPADVRARLDALGGTLNNYNGTYRTRLASIRAEMAAANTALYDHFVRPVPKP